MSVQENNLSHFNVLKETIELTYQQVFSNDFAKKSPPYELNDFWNAYSTTSKLVSHEATKICMSLSSPPLPSLTEVKGLANGLESACLALITAYCGLNDQLDKTLHKAVRLRTLNILKSLQDFCHEASLSGTNYAVSGSAAQLQTVGNVWEQCNLVNNLPKNNKEAVLQIVQGQLSIVDDALVELEESINQETDSTLDDTNNSSNINNNIDEERDSEEDDINNDKWTEADRKLLPNCQGLVKASKATLKKTKLLISNLSADDDQMNSSSPVLDRLAIEIETISEIVDDFVLAVYAPVNRSLLQTNASNLVELLKRILQTIRESDFSPETYNNWTEFLSHAIDHNIEKLIETASKD